MGVDQDHALDTAAALLRILGDHAFDTEDTKAHQVKSAADAWARHLLLASAHPERPDDVKSMEQRDFSGARRFAEALRKSELKFVTRALSDFRQVVWSVVQNVHRALSVDGDDDRLTRTHIDRLKVAIDSNSLDELRKEATAVANNLSIMIASRERRRSEQVELLGLELKSLHQRLEEARRTSETDPLTGLYNRRALDAYMERVAEFDGLTGVPVTLMLLDVDDFKKINDCFGHPAGDEALRTLGRELLRVFLRKCDFVARYGGEEFAVVMRDTAIKDSRNLAERLRERIANVNIPAQPEIQLTVSIGLSSLRSAEDLQGWLARADNALLMAKRSGKDRVVVAPEPG
jgi:diguanylate cyclase (GGDEF)-like protein